MKFTMTLPNMMTIFRVALIPFILYFIVQDTLSSLMIALVLYSVSALTDLFDGILARKLNQMSEFGAYFDPLADKFLVWSIFTVFCFNADLQIPFWLISFIYLRDFYITFLRSYSKKQNIQFKTSAIAKTKTSVQMIVAALIMIYQFITMLVKQLNHLESSVYSEIWKSVTPGYYQQVVLIPLVLTIGTVIFTVITAIDYYMTYRRGRKDSL